MSIFAEAPKPPPPRKVSFLKVDITYYDKRDVKTTYLNATILANSVYSDRNYETIFVGVPSEDENTSYIPKLLIPVHRILLIENIRKLP